MKKKKQKKNLRTLLLSPSGLFLLLTGGLHTVWGIYQLVMYDSSKYFRDDVARGDENSTVAYQFWIVEKVRKWIYPHGSLLKLTIIMYYVGIMLGCFVAGWFLVRVVQKKNIYVSCFALVVCLIVSFSFSLNFPFHFICNFCKHLLIIMWRTNFSSTLQHC